MILALYPGSFDPVTNGHLDVATRASKLFDRLIVGVYDIPMKHLLFSPEERMELMKKAVAHLPNVSVDCYGGLTVEYARRIGAKVVVRGLRMGSDFEREFEMALMSKKLAPELEFIFLMTKLEYEFVSASMIKEIMQLGGGIDDLVPKHVIPALMKKFGKATIKP